MRRVLVGLLLLAVAGVAMAVSGMMGVGRLMGPESAGGGAPPVVTYRLLTESGDFITTQAGDKIVTQ